MYFILCPDANGGWLTLRENGKLKIFESLDDAFKKGQDYPNSKIFCLTHTVVEQIYVANKLAELTNEVDHVLGKLEKKTVL